MNKHEYCVILAGGIGSRFWPVSTEYEPKQFHVVNGLGISFLQNTYKRMLRAIPEENIYVASLARYKDQVMEQLPGISEDRLILEPYRRNTATTIVYAALLLMHRDPEAIMVATPADHSIGDPELFDNTIRQAVEHVAANDVLLTLGIVPTRPDTNFGYIQVAGGSEAYTTGKPVLAKTFTEKPDAELAKVFVDSGEFLWNSGIFIWKADFVLQEMKECCPEFSHIWENWKEAFGGDDKESFVEKAYAGSPSISIDYALMEKSDKVWILPVSFKWGDMGSWSTFYDAIKDDSDNGNAVRTAGPRIVKNLKGDMVYTTDSGKLTVIRGLENFLVVDTDDTLLICPRDDKELQEVLSEIALPEFEKYK